VIDLSHSFGLYPSFLHMVFVLLTLRVGYKATRFLILAEWSTLVVREYIEFFLILVGLISGFNTIV
jgi:hypothetical protein